MAPSAAAQPNGLTKADDLAIAEDAPTPGERAQIMAALARAGFVQAKAARLLGMTVRQLGYRIRKYGIPVERF
jgi:Nif-specific regulatory protein